MANCTPSIWGYGLLMAMGGSKFSRWRFGQTLFDEAGGTLVVDGRTVEIDRNCVALLGALLRSVDQPLSKDDLLDIGWPGRIVHENSLAKAISRLRQAMGEDGARIEAVYGSGYRLNGPVQRLHAIPPNGPGEAGIVARLRVRLFGNSLRAMATCGIVVVGTILILGGLAAWWAMSMRAQVADQERDVEVLLTFLSSDVLAASDPYAPSYQDQSLRQVVERTAATMDSRLPEDPAARAMLHRTIAQTFSGWGEYEKAVSHFDRAQVLNARLYGGRARQNIPIDIGLCQNLRLAGETRRAERICLRAEQVAQAIDSPLLSAAQTARAKLRFEIGEYSYAAATLARVLENSASLSPNERADAEWFYALSQRKLASFDLADDAFRRHLKLRQDTFGASHPLTAWAHADYGDFLVTTGDYSKAERHLAAAQQVFDATLGPDHPEALSPGYSRAVGALWRRDWASARSILRPLLARYREALGSDHFWTLYVMSELALAEAHMGEAGGADALLREARQTGARVLYGREGKAAHFHMRWSRALAALGKADEAEDERRRALEAMDHSGFRPDHPWRARLHCLAARIAQVRGDESGAQQAGKACLSALSAIENLPATYPALAEAKMLATAELSGKR